MVVTRDLGQQELGRKGDAVSVGLDAVQSPNVCNDSLLNETCLDPVRFGSSVPVTRAGALVFFLEPERERGQSRSTHQDFFVFNKCFLSGLTWILSTITFRCLVFLMSSSFQYNPSSAPLVHLMNYLVDHNQNTEEHGEHYDR
jgi:hypothetical protein